MNRYCILLLFVLLLGPSFASGHAQQSGVEIRPMGLKWKGTGPLLSFSALDFSDQKVRRELLSGLPQTIALRVYAYRDVASRPLAVWARSCRVVYDLWEEVFQVQLTTHQGARSLSLKSLDAVQNACLSIQSVPIGGAGDFKPHRRKRVYFAIIIEFNPLSDGTVEKIRRWLARSGQGGPLRGEAFFGSFVSIFVNRRIGSAERVLRVRSPSFLVP